jgi:CRISPR-associated protein Cmr2
VDGPNKILAQLESQDPAGVAKQCKESAQDYLNKKWIEAKNRISDEQKQQLDNDLAEQQVKQFLEFYAAWVPLDCDYAEARKQVERVLAGRKALRDFTQPKSKCGYPKSPLDPSRDCVLRTDRGFAVPPSCQGHPLWLKKRETIDAISILKRIKGATNKAAPTPSTSLMAVRSILPQARNARPDAVAGLERIVQELKKEGLPVDLGDLFFPGRFQEELDSWPTLGKKQQEIECLRKQVLDALGLGECPPYYAILAADGDRMGKLLGTFTKIQDHQKFSEKLAQFAAWAKDCVRSHDGHPIYAGGDDVLALLPVNRALQCAAKLAERFSNSIGQSGTVGGTLSVGVAIVHHMDPLLVSLEHARKAEQKAKETRATLAVALHTRGGEPLLATWNWANGYDLREWDILIEAFRGDLARGLPYELRTVAQEFKGTGLDAGLLRKEVERILERKKGTAKPTLPSFKTPRELEDIAKMMVIARFLASYPEGLTDGNTFRAHSRT